VELAAWAEAASRVAVDLVEEAADSAEAEAAEAEAAEEAAAGGGNRSEKTKEQKHARQIDLLENDIAVGNSGVSVLGPGLRPC